MNLSMGAAFSWLMPNAESTPKEEGVIPGEQGTVTEESSSEEPELESSTIEVSGVSKNTSQETVKMFFESRKRSGGGKTERISYNPRYRNYVITFAEREGKCKLV